MGHREDGCKLFQKPIEDTETNHVIEKERIQVNSMYNLTKKKTSDIEKYGAWILVQKSTRKYVPRGKYDQSKGQASMNKRKTKVSYVVQRKEGTNVN